MVDGNCISSELKVNTGTKVYWSNSYCRTATCIITIIHSKTDKNYTVCFCWKLTPIHTKSHTHDSIRNSVNPLFDLHTILMMFICYFSARVLYFIVWYNFLTSVFPLLVSKLINLIPVYFDGMIFGWFRR
jgi:hypothetical protein